ncbi:MAG TPA: hypothetical protein VFS05_05785 [Gemmatimonadaceae bacterium]|nr:hypothetical protein [Gemmatimonadaceae bacterium]
MARDPGEPRSRYAYNAEANRYVNRATGRFVARAEIRRAIDAALDNAGRRTRALAEQLRAREITLREWQLEMREVVKSVQLYSAAAAKGGWAELTSQDTGRVGQMVRQQYAYLQRFAEQIERGQQPLDGRFARRAMLYAQAGRAAYHLTEREEMRARGFDREANILAASDHCDLCVSETERGPVPIGSLIPIGQRTCMVNCRCRIRYLNSRTGEIAA